MYALFIAQGLLRVASAASVAACLRHLGSCSRATHALTMLLAIHFHTDERLKVAELGGLGTHCPRVPLICRFVYFFSSFNSCNVSF